MKLRHFKDSHVHTIISHDGKSSIPEYIAEAKKKDIDEITFTEHYDIYDGVETKLTTLDVEEYHRKYLALTKNSAVKTKFGIEIGLRPEAEQKIKAMTSANNFDFVIGSSHITCGKDIAMDPSFFNGLTPYQAHMKYFKEVFENINTFDDFDVYGHLDYVVRYGGYKCDYAKHIRYADYSEILDKILMALIKKGKGIEVNSSGIRNRLGAPHPNMDIVQRFVDLGGRIITMGSDAHIAEDLGKHFHIVRELLKRRGVERIAVFSNRTPYFYEL